MRGLVEITREPRGGLGNRLLTFFSLRQIAIAYNLRWASVNQRDSNLVAGINRRTIALAQLRKPQRWRSRKDSLESLRRHLDTCSLDNGYLLLDPPLLGEVYAEFSEVTPREFVKHSFQQCDFHKHLADATETVAIHLGSKSSHEWDPKALPGWKYFESALTHIFNQVDAEVSIRICTDDLENPCIERIAKHSDALVIFPGDERCVSPLVCDFAAQVEASYLVAGPSTFSIAAGMLSRAKIIQYGEWAEEKAMSGEHFWKKVVDDDLVGLPIWKLL